MAARELGLGGSWLSDLPLLVARQIDIGDDNNGTDRWNVGGNNAGVIGTQYQWTSIVDEIILSLTILGSFVILGTMFFLEYRGRPATTRMRLVQSLVLSDLILGIVGIIGTSLVLSGNPLQDGTSTCNALGFCLTAVLWTEHLWTLLLAIATYLILIYPLHPLTLWLERRWYWLWLLVWVFATAIGLVGYLLFGFQPSGGICYYGSNSGLYGELIQFIPRATVMLCITILYARLFVFLRRPDRIRASFSDTDNADLYDSDPNTRRSRFRPRALSNLLRIRKGSKESQIVDKGQMNEKTGRIEMPPRPAQAGFENFAGPTDQISPGSGTATPRPLHGHTPPSTPDEPAPWEQIQLPIFHVDGERFGGREAGGGGLQRENSSIWSGWKGLGKSDKGNSRHRPSTAGSTSPNMASTSRIGSVSTTRDPPASPRSVAAATFPPTLEVDTPLLDSRGEMTPIQARYNAGEIWNHPQDRHGSIASSLGGRVDQLRKQSAISYTVAEEPYTLTSSPSSTSIPIANGGYTSRRPSAPISEDAGLNTTPRPATASRIPVQDDDGEGDNDWDLMQMLQASAPANGTRSQQEGEERIEFVEESMASYLNRKTALLMLWFPLGYVLLFSVSLVRIIYDFAGTPPIALRAVARWFVFSQGILDALIYGLVEWHTKRVIRKRVRKGTFNTPAGSRSGGDRGGTGSALGAMRAFGQGSKNLITSRLGSMSVGGGGTKSSSGQRPSSSGSGANNQTLSRTGGRTPTASFIPVIPESGYMSEPKEVASSDELDLDSTRKGSTAGSGSEVALGTVVEITMPSDGRARERRKEG